MLKQSNNNFMKRDPKYKRLLMMKKNKIKLLEYKKIKLKES